MVVIHVIVLHRSKGHVFNSAYTGLAWKDKSFFVHHSCLFAKTSVTYFHSFRCTGAKHYPCTGINVHNDLSPPHKWTHLKYLPFDELKLPFSTFIFYYFYGSCTLEKHFWETPGPHTYDLQMADESRSSNLIFSPLNSSFEKSKELNNSMHCERVAQRVEHSEK